MLRGRGIQVRGEASEEVRASGERQVRGEEGGGCPRVVEVCRWGQEGAGLHVWEGGGTGWESLSHCCQEVGRGQGTIL